MHPAELAILLHRALEVRLAALQALLAVEGWASEEEPLHQVRVATRRLGAVLDLLDPEAYPSHKRQRRALKRLVDTLGLPRELDVHAAWLETRRHTVPDSVQSAVIEHLQERVDRARTRARRTMHRELEDLRLPDLDRLLEVPSLPAPFQRASLQEAAWTCLVPRAETALGDLAALAAREDAPALHKARIRIKKLRYTVEALEGAFSALPEPMLKDLRALQTILGEYHDLVALETLLRAEEEQLQARGRHLLASGVRALLEETGRLRGAAFDRFKAFAGNQGPAAFAEAVRPALGLPGPEGTHP
ncbi:CHAD domain-containing protein [Geothrix mesophila]|uniref:CHAD domain-containing protein n=1 Tax=Geothrix mesophila TaxID=2922723 RepID=UPI002435CB8A|nr:CHAD domain-containing protein [Geothrix sp. SG198]